MGDFSAIVYTKVIGKKFIFFKKKCVYFQAIYYDSKFFKKKNWPGHFGSLFYRWDGDGKNKGKAPKYLQLDTDLKESKTFPQVTYCPGLDEAIQFNEDIKGDFEVLDSAHYWDNKADVSFYVFNIYDNKNGCHMIYIDGYYAKSNGSKGAHKRAVDLVSRAFKKSFSEVK